MMDYRIFMVVVCGLMVAFAVACAPLRGGEQGGYWEKVTREVGK